MEQNAKILGFKDLVQNIRDQKIGFVNVSRFDLFKGVSGDDGKVHKIRSVGAAYVRDGFKTYTVHLKTLLNETFYLLPNDKISGGTAFFILTRENSKKQGKKYYWNNVGEGVGLEGQNQGLVRLSWDLFSDDIYMSLEPKRTEVRSAS